MANPTHNFTFPLDDQFLSSLQSKLTSLRLSQDPRLCIISLIGQGRLSRCHSKGSLMSGIIGREALRDIPLPPHRTNTKYGSSNSEHPGEKSGNIMIQGHVNLEQRVVYLHLVSIRDAAVLSRLCTSFLSRNQSRDTSNEDTKDNNDNHNNDNANRDSFHSFMAEAEFEAARALLFLFSVSHLVLVNNPGSRFDLGLVRLFRNLETIRQKLQPSLTEALRTVSGISKEWMYAGRPCSPRMLFVFEKNPLRGGADAAPNAQAAAPPSIYGGNAIINNNRNTSDDHDTLQRGGVSSDAIKRLQHNMEDQIYRILRKARVITNISNNSLFAVPANEEFVYVMNKGEGDSVESLVSSQVSSETLDDPMEFLMQKLTASCIIGGSDSSMAASSKASKSSGSLASGGSNQTWSSASMAVSSCSASSVGATAATQSKASLSGRSTPFKAFVQRHIDQALTKGFDDNLGRNPPPALFELPRCGVWFEAAAVMYDFILGGSSSVVVSARAANCISSLKTVIDVDSKFSEARCSKVVPIAIAAYQEGILNHYTRSFHNKRVNDAVISFDSHARGPAYGTFLQQVKDECDAIWQEGRQSCEAMTLTGNHCIHALHRLPSEANASEAAATDLPTKPHQTLNKTLSASNCGTRQASREDPFDIRAANYSFYESLDEGIYDQYNFPLKQETTTPVEDIPVERKVSATSLSKDGSGISASSRGLGDHTPIDVGAGGVTGGVGGGASAPSRGVGDQTSSEGGGSGLGSSGPVRGGGSKGVASTGTAEEKSFPFVGIDGEEKIFEEGEDEKEDESKEIEGIEEILVGGSEGGFDDDADFDGDYVTKTSKVSISITSADPLVARNTSKDSSASFNLVVEPSNLKQQVVLKGMLTTTSPSGSVVEFPSWCLTRIGNAGSYNSGKGLDQPGFLSGSNFLLPWDIQIGEKSSGISAAIPLKGKSTKGYLRQKKTLLNTPNAKDSVEISVIRAYVGYEYECPRGHRFISSAPESADNGVASNASPAEKLVGTDMPLYTLCPCRDRSQKVFIAQLMRIFIVTPDRLSSSSSTSASSIKLLLSPRVQPAAFPAPIFHPGGALQPFPLEPNCLWVLRLPHIYMDEAKVYSQPKDVALFPSCRVIKGLVSLSKGTDSTVAK